MFSSIFREEAHWAALGLQNRRSFTVDKLNKNIFKITQIFIHHKYTNDSAYNDIALYKLENELVFTLTIRPICLYTSMEIPSFLRHQATVAGWGQADTGNHHDCMFIIHTYTYVLYEKLFRFFPGTEI